ncbi:glutathione ABC transporter ATP-binding protein [Natronococcus pandeyae]|uniref:Glutathione ABC transporter ATP-binding protein n=1 Tax=Natronococcus pandeyae TaxID=2055836 RepID=A0A8J8Q868_9EURY|nr:ABC transporter ATP-binding protein [Natronococcus pandeyae]TYL39569.1 glutathione ABC transporter ATP-binding protein [Natronococcus pandeyae]
MTDILTVENLHTQFRTREGPVRAVDGASFDVAEGETVGIVGESGCGKSVTARSIVGLQSPGEIVRGSIRLDGVNVPDATDRQLRRLRGETVSISFQDPSRALNPVFDVGEQIAESLRVHDRPESQGLLDYLHAPLFSRRSAWRESRERAVELMEQVGIASPEDRVDAYPHELSGGMRQRAGLAIAMASDPDLLIADEPTTALDTTTQARILERLRRLTDERGTALLLISHDLGVVADVCDRVVVMYAGQVMETGPTERVLEDPRHPYTRALLECSLRNGDGKRRLPTIEGTVPERTDERSGCPFAPRCSSATDACLTGEVPTVELEEGTAACGEPIALAPSDDAPPNDAPPNNALSSEPTPRAAGRSSGRTTSPLSAAEGPPEASDPLRQGGDAFAESGPRDAPSKPERARSASDRSSAEPNGGFGRDSAADPDRAPNSSGSSESDRATPLVALEGVSKRFSLDDGLLDRVVGESRELRAVDDVTLEIAEGETVGLVGESGSGKSTLADLVTGLETPTSGAVRLDGVAVGAADGRSADELAEVGVIFQNPRSSLNPRLTVEQTLAEPMLAQGWDERRRRQRLDRLLELVGLPERHANRHPHELSGGQVQRVAIARAIALDPQLVVFDEPVSALDVSVQARILNLLSDLQRELELTSLVISHDLDVIEHVADRVAVMYLGELMEVGPTDRVFEQPSHPYTVALLDAIPSLDGGDSPIQLEGAAPSPIDAPSGCPFHTRCPDADSTCAETEPEWMDVGPVRSKCHFPRER